MSCEAYLERTHSSHENPLTYRESCLFLPFVLLHFTTCLCHPSSSVANRATLDVCIQMEFAVLISENILTFSSMPDGQSLPHHVVWPSLWNWGIVATAKERKGRRDAHRQDTFVHHQPKTFTVLLAMLWLGACSYVHAGNELLTKEDCFHRSQINCVAVFLLFSPKNLQFLGELLAVKLKILSRWLQKASLCLQRLSSLVSSEESHKMIRLSAALKNNMKEKTFYGSSESTISEYT